MERAVEGIKISELQSGKNYIIFYTPASGLDGRSLTLEGSNLEDCTVALQPVLDLDAVELVENNSPGEMKALLQYAYDHMTDEWADYPLHTEMTEKIEKALL